MIGRPTGPHVPLHVLGRYPRATMDSHGLGGEACAIRELRGHRNEDYWLTNCGCLLSDGSSCVLLTSPCELNRINTLLDRDSLRWKLGEDETKKRRALLWSVNVLALMAIVPPYLNMFND